MERRLSVWKSASGHVRAGWVLVSYAALAQLGVVGTSFATWRLTRFGVRDLDDPSLFFSSLQVLVGAVLANAVCALLFREAIGLRDVRRGRHFLLGVGVGAVMLTGATVVPAFRGVTSLQPSTTGVSTLLLRGVHQALALAPAGVGEELLLRGLPLLVLARSTRPWFAVVLTGSVFGALHLTNPNASLVAALNVALVGVFFGVVALQTGSLWCSMGLHLAWNFFEGFVFGQPVSGIEPATAIFTAGWPEDLSFWSGGAFGPEAAGWTAVLLVVATAVAATVPQRLRATKRTSFDLV